MTAYQRCKTAAATAAPVCLSSKRTQSARPDIGGDGKLNRRGGERASHFPLVNGTSERFIAPN